MKRYWQITDQRRWNRLAKLSNDKLIKKILICLDLANSGPEITLEAQTANNILRKRFGMKWYPLNSMSYNWFKTGGFPMETIVKVEI